METGGARSVRIIGPYGTPTGLIGTYTAANAYSPPDTIESNGNGGFNPGQAVGKLEGVSYFQGASTNGWQGNGLGGVASYTVASTWATATEQAPTVTYTNPETGDTGTSSATYQTQGASMEQVEVRLQTNKEVEVDKPLSAVFVLTKTTTPMEGGTTSSEFAAVLRLAISSGKISNVCEVVSGTLPPDVTTQGGVVSMRSPAPVAGNTVSLVLLPVDLDIIHPATGELDEWKEDVDDGGYVSVQRLEDPAIPTSDVTPKTKLLIHSVMPDAPADWKVRLKFDAGGRYKIYKDEARTQEVTSESTEFAANAHTTLWFHGLKKSDARGGESITMQIKAGGNWVDGDSVKCTIVQSEFLF